VARVWLWLEDHGWSLAMALVAGSILLGLALALSR
jgi:hypothetical protein